MSLVNDMLRDLEQRWPDAGERALRGQLAAGDGDAGQRPASQIRHGSAPGSSSAHRNLMLCGVLVFVVVLGAGYWWAETGPAEVRVDDSERVMASRPVAPVQESATTGYAAAVSGKPAEAIPELVAVEHSLVSTEVVAVRLPEPESETASTELVQTQINRLLDAAHEALRRDRLTTPGHDNAYDRYRAVLALEEDNQPALQGIEKIRARYVTVLQRARDKGLSDQVAALTHKALEVGVSATVLDRLFASAAASTQRPRQVSQKPAGQSSIAASDSNSLPVVSESFVSRERKALQQFRRLSEQGRLDQAQESLRRFVDTESEESTALEKLFEFYLDSGRVAEAVLLLEQAHGLTGAQSAHLRGRAAIAEDNYELALKWLQSETPILESHVDYYSLLAAVQRQLGLLDEASSNYRALVQVAPANPTYWLGLAVTLDDQGLEEALAAYRRVRQLASQNESYAPYVDQRLRLLAQRR